MDQEAAAKAHIDFLIDDDVKEELGITGRTLSQQVLRLCGGFNDLKEAVEAAEKKSHEIWAALKEQTKELARAYAKIESLKQLMAENTRLKEFARQVIKEQCWGCEMDGFEIQDLAEKLELIAKHTATEDDVEDGDDYEAGDVIYKFTDLLESE